MTTIAEPTTGPDAPTTHTITMGADNLIALLAAVLPFADPEADPQFRDYLRMIRIEAGNGVATAAATDLYVAGYGRKPAAGTLPITMLYHRDAARILKQLRAGDRYRPVEIMLSDDTLSVHTSEADLRFTPADGRSWIPAHLEKLLDPAAYKPVPAGHHLAVRPRFLARVHEAVTSLGSDAARVYVSEPGKPIRLEVEDWFVALIAPLNPSRVKTSDGPQIPFLLPKQPVPLPAAIRDDPKATSRPTSSTEVTVGRLMRVNALQVVQLQRRAFDEPWPDVPPYDQQNPEQRKAANSRADLFGNMLGSYGVAFLLREFAAAAPDAAAKAARDLWEAWDAGDSMGEWACEWLQDYGIDVQKALETPENV
jgi:hypothetical protein